MDELEHVKWSGGRDYVVPAPPASPKKTLSHHLNNLLSS